MKMHRSDRRQASEPTTASIGGVANSQASRQREEQAPTVVGITVETLSSYPTLLPRLLLLPLLLPFILPSE